MSTTCHNFTDNAALLQRLDGSWGEWLRWSPCSMTCGGGSRSRRRYCDDPVPENDGSPCDGEYEKTQVCNNWPCPGEPQCSCTPSLKGTKRQYSGQMSQNIRN